MDTQPLVYVVDDDEMVREIIVEIVQSVGLRVVAISSADHFLQEYQPGTPGCVVTDVRMPGMSGIELAEALGAMSDAIPVIVMTAFSDVDMAVKCMKNGAFDFITKPFREQRILDSIQKAILEDSNRRSGAARRAEAECCLAKLTARESEVLSLVMESKINKVIASDLSLSVKTVDFHRANIMKKLGVESTVELTKLVLAARSKF